MLEPRIDLTEDEIGQIDVSGLARHLGMSNYLVVKALRDEGSVDESVRRRIGEARTFNDLFKLSLDVAPCTSDENACIRAMGWVGFRKVD